MKKLIIIIFILNICGINVLFSQSFKESKNEVYDDIRIIFLRYLRLTNLFRDSIMLVDSSLYSEQPSLYTDITTIKEMTKIISHNKYISYKKELERIADIKGTIRIDSSLCISITFNNDSNITKNINIVYIEQLLEYINLMYNLIENDKFFLECFLNKLRLPYEDKSFYNR